MSRIAVFGPSGMLGRYVVKALEGRAVPVYRRMADLSNRDSIARAVDGCDGAINCAGIIPIRGSTVVDMIYVNGLFPHLLAQTGVHCIQVSTDCVFSGRGQLRYNTRHIPDPRDYYGRTKLVGEVSAPNVCVVRTSFIGCDHGFLSWILAAGFAAKSLGVTQHVDGWKNALWSGSTVQEVANWLVKLYDDREVGLVHLATEIVINKYDLARKIVDLYGLDVEVVPLYQPVLNRALEPTHVLRPLDVCLEQYKCGQAVAVA